MVVAASVRPLADRNTALSEAALVAVPPSQADSR
jgi:hypothetical protein